MIDALFGSKTRVKLLHLFLNNPGKAFFVREITRLIDEQINSVRRELANMLEVGIITSKSTDNKLYYEVNQRYEYYVPFRAMFADQKVSPIRPADNNKKMPEWHHVATELSGARVIVSAGRLVRGSASKVDLLVVGDISARNLANLVGSVESAEARELAYTVLTYDEFYYRLSVHDRFISDILTNKHSVLLDVDGILKN